MRTPYRVVRQALISPIKLTNKDATCDEAFKHALNPLHQAEILPVRKQLTLWKNPECEIKHTGIA